MAGGGALAILGEQLRFERALFHELSSRAPLEGAAVVGLDVERIGATMSDWDGFAVELGALRDTALAQGGWRPTRKRFGLCGRGPGGGG